MKLFVGALGVVGMVLVMGACGGGGGGASITGGSGGVTGGGGGGVNGAVCPANTVCMLFQTTGAYDATGSGSFTPTTMTVAPGSTVSFTNNSGVAHNVVFNTPAQTPPGGDIGTISSGTQQRTFPTAGTYAFHCTLHDGMTGTITVQ